MRSVFSQSHFHSTQLIFSNSQHYLEPILNTKNKELHLVQFHIFTLNTNARMYLYNTPMDTMDKDPIFQSLCLKSIWTTLGLMPNTSNSYLFMCFIYSCPTQMFHNSCSQELMLNKNIKYSCASKLYAQHQFGMLQVIFPTLPILIFSCASYISSQHNVS